MTAFGRESDDETSPLTLASPDHTQKIIVRFPATDMADLCRHLTAHGFVVGKEADNARSLLTETLIATASNPGAWTALGATIVAYLRRDRGKAARFKVDDMSFSVHGYSAREAARLAAELAELTRAHEEPDDLR